MKDGVLVVRPMFEEGGCGPYNGMYALQLELRKRSDTDCKWLQILPQMLSFTEIVKQYEQQILWVWDWCSRRVAIAAAAAGWPLILGPNVMFIDVSRPRSDWMECALLDTDRCVMMFCHTERYKKAIERHLGHRNMPVFSLWPYPVHPMPPPPQPPTYDLLVYIKSGCTPALLELIDSKFKNNIKLRYREFTRGQLYDAASKSRACLYISVVDHGPVALSEILAAGCPTVGLADYCPYVVPGFNGVHLGSLVADTEHNRYAIVRAIEHAMTLDREAICADATAKFSPQTVGDMVISALEMARRIVRFNN